MTSSLRGAVLGGAALLLAGCAAGTAENCDAADAGNIFQDYACKSQGGYDERVQQIRERTREKIARTNLTQRQTAEIRDRAEALSNDADALQKRVQDMRADLASLRLRANTITARNENDRAQLQVLREQLGEADRTLDQLAARPTVTPEQVARVETEVAKKKAAVNEFLDKMSVVE